MLCRRFKVITTQGFNIKDCDPTVLGLSVLHKLTARCVPPLCSRHTSISKALGGAHGDFTRQAHPSSRSFCGTGRLKAALSPMKHGVATTPIAEVIDARTANLHFMWSLLYKHNECKNPLVGFQNCLWTDERRCQTFG